MVCCCRCWCYFSIQWIFLRWLWKKNGTWNGTYLFYISHHNSHDIWASDFCSFLYCFFSFLHIIMICPSQTIDRWTHSLFDLFWIFFFLLKTIIKSQFNSQMDFVCVYSLSLFMLILPINISFAHLNWVYMSLEFNK